VFTSPNARVTTSGMVHAKSNVALLTDKEFIGPAAGPDFRPDAYSSITRHFLGFILFRHGSTEAEESTRQTFLVYALVP
jgi:hypothetical protein